MNTKITMSLIGCMLFSSAALAEVTMHIPDSVTILVANGTKAKLSGGVFDSGKTLHLPDGQQQVVFRYKPFFRKGNENVGVESQVTVAKFQARQQKLTLALPQYRNYDDAEAHIKTMNWSIQDDQQRQLPVTKDQLSKDGIQFGRNFYTEMAVYNQSHKAASVPAFVPGYQPGAVTVRQSAPVVQQSGAAANGPSVESMLHYWYSQADAATKQKFKHYVNQH